MVKPTLGMPLFLSAVAVGSFAVHVAVLSNTTWVSDFLSGNPLGSGAAVAALTPDEPKPATVAFLAEGSQDVLITMSDGTTARAVLQLPQTLAALE